MHYRDLMNADGTLNRSAFEGIVAARTEYEINLALCVDNALTAPAHVGLGQIAAWRAAQVSLRHLDTLTDRERAEIENGIRTAVAEIFRAMRDVAIERGEIAATKAA